MQMRKCLTCKNKVWVLRQNGLCDTCSGKLWCQEHGHDFESITFTTLAFPVYLGFKCKDCGIERTCYVVPRL